MRRDLEEEFYTLLAALSPEAASFAAMASTEGKNSKAEAVDILLRSRGGVGEVLGEVRRLVKHPFFKEQQTGKDSLTRNLGEGVTCRRPLPKAPYYKESDMSDRREESKGGETSLSLHQVDFYGDKVLAVQNDSGEVYVPAKPICERFGIDWSGQLSKFKTHQVLSKGVEMISIPYVNGGEQDTTVLKLNLVPLWLATIQPSRIPDPQVREAVIRYQEECADVLYSHFFGQRNQAHSFQQLTSVVEKLTAGLHTFMESVNQRFAAVEGKLYQQPVRSAEANQRIPAFHIDRLRHEMRQIVKIKAWVFGGKYRSIMSSLTREMEEIVGCGYTKAPMSKLSTLERFLRHRYSDLEKMGAVDSYKTAQQGDLFKGLGQKRGDV